MRQVSAAIAPTQVTGSRGQLAGPTARHLEGVARHPPLISSMAGPDDGPAVVRRDLAKEVLGGGEEENGGEVSHLDRMVLGEFFWKIINNSLDE